MKRLFKRIKFELGWIKAIVFGDELIGEMNDVIDNASLEDVCLSLGVDKDYLELISDEAMTNWLKSLAKNYALKLTKKLLLAEYMKED